MALYRITAIESFDFAKPEECPRWIRCFERFRQASELASKSEEVQISTLVYSMGDKAEDLLQSFSLKDDEAKKYLTVKGKFESYFVKHGNTIYERARFNRCKQEEEETVDEFITDLHHLADNCGYGTLRDELVRDRIVVGIRDSKLSEKMQMDPDLTLESAVTQARQSKSVKKQQAVVRGDATATVEAVKTRSSKPRPLKYVTTRVSPQPQRYTRCGKSPPHSRPHCPANEAECHKCHKRGHFRRCCKSKTFIKEVTQDSEEETFLRTVTADTVCTSKPWTVELQLNNRVLEFKVDTGADITVIPEKAYQSREDGKLRPTSIPLNGPTGEKLNVYGQFTGLLTRKSVESQQEIYVFQNLSRALLGRPVIQALNVAVQIEPVQGDSVIEQFPELF